MKKRNILLCGLSGSGKTTLAKYLNKEYGYSLLRTSDEIHNSLREKIPFIFKKGEKNINSFSYDLTQFCTKVIQSVEIILKSKSKEGLVFDACNLKEKTRNNILKILGKNSIIIKLECDEDDYLNRFRDRSFKEDGTFDDVQFQTWFNLHQKQQKESEFPEKFDIIFNSSKNDFSIFDSEFDDISKY